jgi:hypothetical protein
MNGRSKVNERLLDIIRSNWLYFSNSQLQIPYKQYAISTSVWVLHFTIHMYCYSLHTIQWFSRQSSAADPKAAKKSSLQTKTESWNVRPIHWCWWDIAYKEFEVDCWKNKVNLIEWYQVTVHSPLTFRLYFRLLYVFTNQTTALSMLSVFRTCKLYLNIW